MTATAAKDQQVAYPEPPDVLIAFKDTDGDLDAIAKIVTSHEALEKEVLATINAPYFSLVREIKSAGEAVRMLGKNRILNLTTARLLRTTLFSGKEGLVADLWGTSLKTAVIAVLVSKELDKATTDQAYTAALFHNSGMALMAKTFPDYKSIIQAAYHDEAGQISDFEIAKLGINHSDVGAQLAINWGLPADIARAIKAHHSPEATIKLIEGNSEAGEILLILKISEYIARLPGYLAKSTVDHEWEVIKEPIFDQLKLTEGMFKRFEAGIKKKLAEIKS